MKDTKLFVVLPCYNEEEVLGKPQSACWNYMGK